MGRTEFLLWQLARHGAELGLGRQAQVHEVIRALEAAGRFEDAAALLFGRNDFFAQAQVAADQLGLKVFNCLVTGKKPGLITKAAENHHWASGLPAKGFGIRVGRGRFIVFPEPVATEIFQAAVA